MAITWPGLFKATDDFKNQEGGLENSQNRSGNDLMERRRRDISGKPGEGRNPRGLSPYVS